MMKRILSVVMVLTIIMGCVGTGYANEKIGIEEEGNLIVEHNPVMYYSERDIIIELQSKSDTELSEMGYTPEKITELRSLSDEVVVENARNKSDAELLQNGLTAEEIDFIRTTDNLVAAANVTYGRLRYSVEEVSWRYETSSNTTHFNSKATWEWITRPVFYHIDIIATAVSENSGLMAVSCAGKAYYKNSASGSVLDVVTLYGGLTDSASKSFCKFDLNKMVGGDLPMAFEGESTTYWTGSGKIDYFSVCSNYGHSTALTDPNVSVGTGFSISFTPSSVDYNLEEATRLINHRT